MIRFNRVKGISRSRLFTQKESSEVKNSNCFVVDYHPAFSVLYGIFRELQQIVGLSDSFLSVMPEPPMICFRRCKNLKDHLVRSTLPRIKETVGGMFKCGSKKCKVCHNLVKAEITLFIPVRVWLAFLNDLPFDGIPRV